LVAKPRTVPIRVTKNSQRFIILVMIVILIALLFGIRPAGILFIPISPTHERSVTTEKDTLGLDYPQGIAANHKKEWLYVTSSKYSRVFVFDKNYEKIFDFGEDALKIPVFVAVDKKGTVYVTDRAQKAVLLFSQDGVFKRKLKLEEINNPLAITVDDKNNIYVSDTGKEHRILKYNADGKLILKFGHKKKADSPLKSKGGLFFPNGIAIDNKQNIYVADSNNGRIQIFDKNGEFKKIIITGGLPRGIAINKKHNVFFIADALRHKVYMYDLKTGKERANFSQLGSSESDVAFPNALVLTGNELEKILIVDRENSRVQIYTTRLSASTVGKLLRPYLPWLPLPLLVFLMLFLISRRRRYIVSDCFATAVLKDPELVGLVRSTKLLSISPTLFEKLGENQILDIFNRKPSKSARYNHSFAQRIRKEHKLTISQSEALALAHHKGIYQPVLLACDKKIIKAAEYYHIEVMDPKKFFKIKE